MFWTLFLVFYSLHISVSNAGDACPSKETLSPCSCVQKTLLAEVTPLSASSTTTPVPRKKRGIDDNHITPEFSNGTSYYYTVVKCDSPKSLNDLEEPFSHALNRKWIDKLVISNMPPEMKDTLARLPPGMLNHTRIRQLEIKKTQLCGDFLWPQNPLADQAESLYWLKVSNCYLTGGLSYDSVATVKTAGLRLLRRLQGVDFSSNHLSVIFATAFKYPPVNLTTVILSNNNIRIIDTGAFQYIPLLKHIDLSHNLLQTVLRTYFAAPARYLEYIDMSWNSIRILPVDFFVNMPALKSVDFSNNFLFSLPANPWSVVWKTLSFIDVSGNFVECDCALLWIVPILLPPNTNQTEPKPLPGQTVTGHCVQLLSKDSFETAAHELVSLKRDRLNC